MKKEEFSVNKLYDHAYDWIIRFGPKLLVGLLVLFIGLWLIKMIVNWSHNGMHRKEMDPSVKPFLFF